MKFKFTKEMFHSATGFSTREQIAEMAQAALDAYLATCPVVYASPDRERFWDNEEAKGYDTHTAVLMNVMPIPSAPCKHDPRFSSKEESMNPLGEMTAVCAKCGVKLTAKWEPAE